MAHPQNSPRGLFAKKRIDLGGNEVTYNSTAMLLSKALVVNGQTTKGLISANSTALTLPNGVKITGAHANATITANSTGIKVGTKYLSTNSTGTTL